MLKLTSLFTDVELKMKDKPWKVHLQQPVILYVTAAKLKV